LKMLGGYHLFSSLKFFGNFFSFFDPPPSLLEMPEIFPYLLFSSVARFSTVVERYWWQA
jgi:hypothetical protein